MEYETREYERNYRRSARNNDGEETKPVDFITPVIVVQFVVFLLIFLVLFAFYKKQSDSFKQIRSFYIGIMQNDMTAKQLAQGVKSALEFISRPRSPADNEASAGDAENMQGAGGEDLLRITSNFGYRKNPVTGKYGFHSGLDIASPEGTPIKAAFDGVVEEAKSSEARGNYIFLKSGNVTTVYCHCSVLSVKRGDRVKAGDVIAKVGSTGQATGPHLHFEIVINSIHYNPEWVLENT